MISLNNKLPKVYVQKQNKVIKNNKEYFYGSGKNIINDDFSNKVKVIKKLNLIFSRYAYKYDLLIKTKDYESKEVIILKTKDYLLTINNKMIPIEFIIDVDEVDAK